MEKPTNNLIIEDDPQQREYLAHLLQRLGIEAHSAGTQKEALECIKTHLENQEPFSFIFLDIQLPDGSGHEILAHIRHLERQ
ncbi:MAG: response regulator, partial [Termitinemataceae bacterium]